MVIATTLCLLCAHLFIIYPLYRLCRNYVFARKSGLRTIVSPITPYTLQWQLVAGYCRPHLQRYRWFRALDWTSCWKDDDKLHQELGLSFIVVAPGHNVLCTSDPKTIEHVLKNWRDYVKPDNVNEILGTFGQNVDTSNGDDWIRHRKLTAPCFNERASATVWNEASQQSKTMIEHWTSSPKGISNGMIEDLSIVALNVISSVAFENTRVNEPTLGHTLSLRDALITVMSTSISPTVEAIMPLLKLPMLQPLLPANIKRLLSSMREFRQYMDETIAKERLKVPENETKVDTLISTLIKANDEVKTDTGVAKGKLSDVELRGNIFIFTVGGLESTFITLSYALALLAVYPEVQDWVAEELDEVLSDETNGEMEYARVFPRLKRVMAVMYETLRLYGPSPPLPRSRFPTDLQCDIPTTGPKSKESTVIIRLPANTQIMLNSWASHTSSANFPNALTWNPERWIQPHRSDSTKETFSEVLNAEKLRRPVSGSGFFAWGAGPRICPGMKFSQVEFCSVLSSILKRIKVKVVCGEDMHVEVAKQEVLAILRDSCADPLLLHVRHPGKLELRVIKR